LLVLVGSLVVYKSTGALRQVERARVTGSIATRAALVPTDSTLLPVRVAARSLNYLDAVWPALAFGILISGAIRAFTPVAALSRVLDRGGFRGQLVAGASGAPLMLCSCCVAPIFSSVYERSRQLAPSLAVMLAAPALNPVALLLTFLLFPRQVAWARLLMSVGAVLAGTALVARFAGGTQCAPVHPPPESDRQSPRSSSDAFRFAVACGHVALRTVPVILIGLVVAVVFADGVELDTALLPSIQGLAIAVTAIVALPLALPTFFEIPLAAGLLSAGAPVGAAAAVLFVGPAVNLPSLLTVGHAAGWKPALLVAFMVWLFALVGGLAIGW
jgi:hypothetical protein